MPQACWHLSQAIRLSMLPGPHKPIKVGMVRKLMLIAILLTGRIPAGAHASERITPTKETPESAIDDFFATLDELKLFNGEFAPNPMFGQISHGHFVRLHLIHCAHHFGFLAPTNC